MADEPDYGFDVFVVIGSREVWFECKSTQASISGDKAPKGSNESERVSKLIF